MIPAALTTVACLLVVWLLRNRTVWVLGLIMALYVAIPSQADGLIVPFLHPASYLTLALVGQHLVTRDRSELRLLVRPGVPVIIGLVLVMSLSMLDLLNPWQSDPQWVVSTDLRIFVVPFLLFPLTLIELRRRPASQKTLRRLLLIMALVQVVIAYVQYTSDMEQWVFWRSYYELSYWWTDTFPIPLGTMGHPLQLAAFLAMCIPLLARLKSPITAVIISGVLLYACALSTGRASTALAALGVVFVIVWHGRRWLAAGAAAALAGALGFEFWRSEGAAALRDKVQDDQGSARLRAQALQWAIEHLDEYLWFGYPGGHDLRGTGILRSSLENGYLIAGLAFGLTFSLGLLLLHLYTMLRPIVATRAATPETVATFTVWVGFFASSSFMGYAVDGRSFWLIAAMAWAAAFPLTTSEATLDQGQTDAGADSSVSTGTTPGLSAAG
ncbi:AraC family transcriptional regulator [Janibacter hoylei PVAS-1]|uniref:AraC family transcriptional regulator n=1 Tax=Janibacter hoylei PVAS-1 TaxID=1210046 RepID=K1ERX6_9MICO|nr:hypothetical protein [Janibacter hoylei]EKA61953.1 AraC family transcriptional regulator [Janibacter hoylei PVAS-1]RWU84476.1 hypothetical protein CWN80_04840 [Janibacter hoylei PVAS-1]